MTDLTQLKLANFRQLEQAAEVSGGYGAGMSSLNEAEYRNLQADAQRDHMEALETFTTAQGDLPEAYADSQLEGQLGRQAIAKAARELLLEHNFIHSDQFSDGGRLPKSVLASEGFEALWVVIPFENCPILNFNARGFKTQ